MGPWASNNSRINKLLNWNSFFEDLESNQLTDVNMNKKKLGHVLNLSLDKKTFIGLGPALKTRALFHHLSMIIDKIIRAE